MKKNLSLFNDVKLAVFDFDGVFTDNSVWVDQHGQESVRCWRSDGIGLQGLKDLSIPAYVISTESNPVVTVRTDKLKIPCKQNVHDKEKAIKDLCSEMNIPLKNTMFVGNDINDLPALKQVGIPVAVADAYPDILPFVKYVTEKPGGYGAVRELCDLIKSAKEGYKEK